MPTYEYVCTDCKEKFDVFATLSQKEKGLEPTCPKCQSTNAIQVFSSIAVFSRGSGGGSSSSSMPGCGPICGPGTC